MRETSFNASRTGATLASLSAIGAAVAGFGVGVLLATDLKPLAWPAVVVGIAVHLFGMVGATRIRTAGGYMPSVAERAGFWLCWAIIAALLVYGAAEIVR